mmetsp:Transcript_11349/g.24930  ORF Transcript_11349/g.24930 Transcript_11349/m.24930 type:complete len:173 (-) Transcript_11349:565-1083(-)
MSLCVSETMALIFQWDLPLFRHLLLQIELRKTQSLQQEVWGFKLQTSEELFVFTFLSKGEVEIRSLRLKVEKTNFTIPRPRPNDYHCLKSLSKSSTSPKVGGRRSFGYHGFLLQPNCDTLIMVASIIFCCCASPINVIEEKQSCIPSPRTATDLLTCLKYVNGPSVWGVSFG